MEQITAIRCLKSWKEGKGLDTCVTSKGRTKNYWEAIFKTTFKHGFPLVPHKAREATEKHHLKQEADFPPALLCPHAGESGPGEQAGRRARDPARGPEHSSLLPCLPTPGPGLQCFAAPSLALSLTQKANPSPASSRKLSHLVKSCIFGTKILGIR